MCWLMKTLTHLFLDLSTSTDFPGVNMRWGPTMKRFNLLDDLKEMKLTQLDVIDLFLMPQGPQGMTHHSWTFVLGKTNLLLN